MHVRHIRFLFTALIILFLQSVSFAQAEPAEPSVTDRADFEEFRRIWGSPDGAFYLMERGGCEVRTYPDEKTRRVRLRGSRKLVSSERGNYYGVIRYNSFSPSALSIREITIYSRDGEKQYKIANPDCTAFVISDAGPHVVAISGAEGLGETHLKFYNQDGKLVGDTKVQDFTGPSFSSDGTYLFALTTGGLLVKFSNSGKRLREYDYCRKYFLADNGQTVATYADSILTIYKDTDPPIGLSVPDPDLREVAFSDNAARLAMLSPDRLEVFDLNARELLGEYQLEDSTFQLLHMAAGDDLKSIVCSASNAGASPEVRHRTGKVILLDGYARKLWEEELSYNKWSIRYPEVRINRAGNIFSVLTASGLAVYEL